MATKGVRPPKSKNARGCARTTMTARTKGSIVLTLQKHGEQIRALGVHKLGLFGSFVRGEQNEGSDVDVLVEFVPGKKGFDNFLQLAFLLEELLQRRVELVTPESLSPYIRPYILREIEYVAFSA